jgi:hypothetical protein
MYAGFIHPGQITAGRPLVTHGGDNGRRIVLVGALAGGEEGCLLHGHR